MKIFVINGSPRRERSDTMRIIRTFLDGMNETEPRLALVKQAFEQKEGPDGVS